MLSWNSWYNPLDNVANVAKGFGNTLTGGAIGSQYNTMSNPQTVYNPTPSTPKPSVLGTQTDPGAMYFDSSSGRVLTPDGLRADGSAWPTGGGSGGSGGSGGGAPAAPAYDPYELQLLNQSLASAGKEMGRFDQYEQTGLANLLSSFNRGNTQIANDRTQARGQYDTTKAQNTQDYTNTRSGIRQDSGNLYNSIQRLLGGMGAGRSSAARVLAPFAVGQQAAQRFGGVQEQFGRNMGQLDTSWANTERGLNDSRSQLEEDWKNQQNELKSGLNQNRASLEDRIAQMRLQRGQLTGGSMASLMPQIEQSQNRVNSLLDANVGLSKRFANPKLNVARNTFKAPNLKDYNYSRFDAPRLQGGGYDPRADYTNPLTGVLNRDEEELR